MSSAAQSDLRDTITFFTSLRKELLIEFIFLITVSLFADASFSFSFSINTSYVAVFASQSLYSLDFIFHKH